MLREKNVVRTADLISISSGDRNYRRHRCKNRKNFITCRNIRAGGCEHAHRYVRVFSASKCYPSTSPLEYTAYMAANGSHCTGNPTA